MGCGGVDNEPPHVWISSPGEADTVTGVVIINAQATDNKGVENVEIYINNMLAHTTTASPYFYDWVTDSIQQDSSLHTIFAKAFDAAENEATSDTISVVVDNDTIIGRLKWSYSIGDTLFSSPAIGADGTIYVGSLDGYLYAINPDGTFKWRYQTSGAVYSSPAISAGGMIYIGSYDFDLYAITSDGALSWTFPTGQYVHSTGAIGSDGTIYIGSNDHCVYALNPSGSLRWSYATGGDVRSSPAIGPDGTIYVGSYDGYLYAIYGTGTLANTDWPMFHHDIVHSGRIGG